ncbi:hypothetical protein FRB94_006480 [Tulasnella sp. JGI-2019a]|nr:hypothetical protein FRB94_006480 [Tulasnella sp. JGI-2019a]KAG8999129.1 hypothetical protein FRB93_013286 [Tulasnella sp. JGI-2019a]KAG9028476.1 hypothetical protein FRB95_006418 [Tulasnella sp. JGI-2019a]
MPVPTPKRSSQPPPSDTSPFADIKERRKSLLLHSPSPTTALRMNGYSNGNTNGHANGDVTTRSEMRRRSGRKHNKRGSTSSSGSASLASSSCSSSSIGDDQEVDEIVNGNGNTKVESASLHMPTRREYEEWKGIMKKVVDQWEIPRKVLHSSIGVGVVYLYSTRPDNVKPVVYALSASLAVIIPADIIRLRYPAFERIYEKVLGVLMRESERDSPNGVIWYMIGVIYVLLLLPRDLAVMSILILSWCDTAASTFGRLWGRYTPALPRRVPILNLPLAPKKSLAGSLAATLTGALTAVVFWGCAVPAWQGYGQVEAAEWGPVAWKWANAPGVGIIEGGAISLGLIGLVVGLISGITEALDLGGIDDNLSLPIISGTVLWGLSKFAAWMSNFQLA